MEENHQLEEKAQGLVEYSLVLLLVVVIVALVLSLLGPYLGTIFSNVVELI